MAGHKRWDKTTKREQPPKRKFEKAIDDKPTIREEVADMESQKLDNHTAIGPPCTKR